MLQTVIELPKTMPLNLIIDAIKVATTTESTSLYHVTSVEEGETFHILGQDSSLVTQSFVVRPHVGIRFCDSLGYGKLVVVHHEWPGDYHFALGYGDIDVQRELDAFVVRLKKAFHIED